MTRKLSHRYWHTGWGRIHVVERLAQTENSEIKEWLLREGYRNSVMYEYLAFTCATAGGLLSALSEDQVDREMLTSAGEIIQALICGGPAESIEDYDDGALVVEMYLRHIEPSADTLTDFLNVNIIKTFLTEDDADWESRSEQGWTSQRRSELSAACDEILSLPVWVERVQLALVSQDELEFHQADQTAKALGIDTWEHHWRRLQEKPTDSGCWYHVMAMVDDDRLPQVIAAAENWIDLAGIATGASDEMGMGPDYEPHSCLDCVLQELRRFPGHGAMFIEAGLKSPVVRNRNMAVAALADWGQDVWTSPTHESLKMAAKVEPEDEVKERMQKVLNGESLED